MKIYLIFLFESFLCLLLIQAHCPFMRAITILFTLLISSFSFAQKGTTSFGLQFKPIVPVSYFNAGPVNLSDSIVNIEIKQIVIVNEFEF